MCLLVVGGVICINAEGLKILALVLFVELHRDLHLFLFSAASNAVLIEFAVSCLTLCKPL